MTTLVLCRYEGAKGALLLLSLCTPNGFCPIGCTLDWPHGRLLPSSLLRLLVSALGDVIPRMPLMEYEEPAESVLTDDTCVTEPVDTARRQRGGQGQQEAERWRAWGNLSQRCVALWRCGQPEDP